jgi:hypothetical protein
VTTRDGRGKFERTVDGVARDAKAARLRARGKTYEQIATELGYSDRSEAWRGVKRVLDGIVTEARDEAVKIELDRLDHMWREVITVLETRHFVISDGRIVFRGEEALLDDAPVLHAVDRLLKIADRRAKLLGLDQPRRVEVSDATPDLDAAVRDLAAELAAAAGDTEVPRE